MRRAQVTASISFVAALLALSCGATAQTGVTWTGSGGGLWSEADNWDPKIVPNNSPPTFYNVTVNQAGPLVDGGFSIARLDLDAGILLTESSNLGFQSASGTAIINGIGQINIDVAAPSAPTSIVIASNLTLQGGGGITMGGAGTARIIGAPSSSLTNNSWTIAGEGRLAEGFLALTNGGTIAASNGTLLVQAAGCTNSNIMRTLTGGTLHISGSFGSLNNAGGTVFAGGGLVQLSGNLHVTGGTLRSDAGSFEAISSGGGTHRLRNLSNEANFFITGSTVEIQDTIINSGTFTLNGGNMRVVNAATLTGGGTVRMNTDTMFTGVGTMSSLTLDHGTIRGAGNLGFGQLGMTVGTLGRIEATGSLLFLSPSALGLVNNGTLVADAGTLVISGISTLSNSNGRIRAEDGSSVVLTNNIAINGGTIETAGSGTVAVGNLGTARFTEMTINGNMVLGGGATGIFSGQFLGTANINMQPSSLIRIAGSARFGANGRLLPDGAVIRAAQPQDADGPAAELVNDGLIEGNGSIGADELQITNNGTIRGDGSGGGVLTLDPSSDGMMNAGVIEATGAGQVVLSGNGAGDFTQDSAGVIRAADAGSNIQLFNNTRLSGGQLGAGAGSISVLSGSIMLQDITNHANLVLVGVSSLQMNGMVLNNGSITTSTNSRLIVNGSLSLSGGGAGHFLSNGSITVNTGGQLDAQVIEGTGTTAVQTGGTLSAHSIRQNRLTINDGASAQLKSAAPGSIDPSRVGSLSIGAAPAYLDVTNRVLIIDQSGPAPLATLRSQIITGHNGGTWDGPGIRSSTAAATPDHGVGFGEASAIFTSFPATYFGQTVDNSTLLLTFTRYGDANLDRVVGLEDFNRLAANFGLTNRTWTQADFTYDGLCNLADFNALAGNFGLSAGPSGPTPQDWANLASAVPEPAGFLPLGIAFALKARRRVTYAKLAGSGSP